MLVHVRVYSVEVECMQKQILVFYSYRGTGTSTGMDYMFEYIPRCSLVRVNFVRVPVCIHVHVYLWSSESKAQDTACAFLSCVGSMGRRVQLLVQRMLNNNLINVHCTWNSARTHVDLHVSIPFSPSTCTCVQFTNVQCMRPESVA